MASLENFTELQCWKACQELKMYVLLIIKKFPKDEKFDLTDNLRRAARSTTRNIAEGFGRHTHKDNAHFVRIARGSLYEVQDDLLTAELENYITNEELNEGMTIIKKALNLTNGYIKYLKSL